MRCKMIRSRIESKCVEINRDPDSVKLLLATKTVEPDRIKQALASGINYIGENKIQELKRKRPELDTENVKFHFIGHLQTNKIKDAIQFSDCIESVDRIHLVEALDKELQKQSRSQDILIQVNTSYEESKFGISPEEAISFVKKISTYGTLKVKGLMTIGIFKAEKEKIRKCFHLLSSIANEIKELGLPNTDMGILSMGMSHDFETAIEEGSTLVRIGTAIFGERIYPDSYYWDEKMHVL